MGIEILDGLPSVVVTVLAVLGRHTIGLSRDAGPSAYEAFRTSEASPSPAGGADVMLTYVSMPETLLLVGVAIIVGYVLMVARTSRRDRS